jgi:hypothetical protein
LYGVGGYDFRQGLLDVDAEPPIWTPTALPSVVLLIPLPDGLADPNFTTATPTLFASRVGDADFVVRRADGDFRAHAIAETSGQPAAVVLPLDQLFEHRASAAMRLWRAVTGRAPGPDMAALSPARQDRLLLALRALDGRLEDASYRDIAVGLFGVGAIPERGWKTHDLRDRTVRLVRYGVSMMQGDYRHLLLYPFRHKQ